MPWYAQRADLPDTHKMWADPGSQHEQVLQHLGMVEVPAPGAELVDETPPDETGDARDESVSEDAPTGTVS